MTGTVSDYLVVGSSAFARLLAGLLRDRHGRSVILAGNRPSPFRLPLAPDLSVAPITRPETWALLTAGVPETLKIIGRIAGRNAWRHLDAIFCADDGNAIEALGHVRHMAQGFGITVEPLRPDALAGGRTGMLMRDAVCLEPSILEAALDAWLGRLGIAGMVPETIGMDDDGSGTLTGENGVFRARQVILAGPDAILRHLPAAHWPHLLVSQTTTSLLLGEAAHPAAPMLMDLSSGVTMWQRIQGDFAAFGTGEPEGVAGRVSTLLGRGDELQLAAQSTSTTVVTRDGGPVVGRLAGTGADIVAGLGSTGVFLAPAIARWICGEATAEEAAWFGSRLVSRSPDDLSVAEPLAHLEGKAP